MAKQKKKLALVLGGGGARAGYQVGVIKALAELSHRRKHPAIPFKIVCGTSAGGINATALASYAHNFHRASAALQRIWGNFHCHHVLRSDFVGVSKTGARWLLAMALGGLGKNNPLYLYDRAPLHRLIRQHMPMKNITRYINNGILDSIGITASGYSSGDSMTFFQGNENIQNWERARRKGRSTKININHLMASSAIPFLFEAVKINQEYYGDGSIRQTAPLSPALHMGADAILAIGNRYKADDTKPHEQIESYPNLAQIAGHTLDSIFLDSLEADLERLSRINNVIEHIPEHHLVEHDIPMREVNTLVIDPSADIGEIAHDFFHELPWTMRYFMRGIGAHSRSGSANFVSYLMFEKGYCQTLIHLGYKDAMNMKDEIQDFLAQG